MSATLLKRHIDKRATAWEGYQEVMERAESDGRDLSAEESETLARLDAEITEDSKTIERLERAANLADKFVTGDTTDPDQRSAPDDDARDGGYDAAFAAYMRGGNDALDADQRQLMQSEFRAQGEGTDSAGGYTVPEGFRQTMTETMKAFGGLMQHAEVINTSTGQALPWPTVDDTGNVGALLSENTQVTEQDMTFGTAQLDAYTYTSKLIRVSLQLLQDSAFNLDTWLPNKLGERIGRAIAAHLATGTGTAQPQGLFVGAAVGDTTAAVAAITYDELIDLQHSVDPAYRESGRARWVFNDTTFAALRKLKDADGRPLWQPSIALGAQDTFLGAPYTIDQGVAGVGAGNKPIGFGDVQAAFAVRMVTGGRVMRLTERYADFLQVGFLGFRRVDAVVQDAGAFKVSQNAAV